MISLSTSLLTFSLFFAMTTKAFGACYLSINGGGGEPVRDHTIFDEGMEYFATNLEKSKCQYDLSFNGGHKNTELILKSKFKRATNTPFTSRSYIAMIESYKTKILSGQITSKDQLVIVINTHGGARKGTQASHSISVTGSPIKDFNDLSGSETVSLDELKELTTLAESKNIKLGIIDLSCHSGATQALKNSNTCIISASSPKHYAYSGAISFPTQFFQELKPGRSLEEAYLAARAKTEDSSYPMISTDEHFRIENDIYSGLTPYLYHHNESSTKLYDYLLETAKNDALVCRRDSQFHELMNKISSLEKNFSNIQTQKIRDLLERYKAIQDDTLKKLLDLKAFSVLKNEEIFYIGNSKAREMAVLTWEEILYRESLEQSLKGMKAMYNMAKNDEKESLAERIDHLNQILKRRKEIIRKHPTLNNYPEKMRRIKKEMENTLRIAQDIASEERALYHAQYQSLKAKNKNDPCKGIIF